MAIGRGLVDRLSPGELRATLAHERCHVRARDPLRSLIATTLTAALLPLPALAALQRRWEARRELAADAHAERACGRRMLAGALLAALEDPRHEQPAAGIPFASPELLRLRIARLQDSHATQPHCARRADLAWPAVGCLALVAVYAAAGLVEALCLTPAVAVLAFVALGSHRR
ncbi:MAG: M48 family metalloprotease [Conexibacter sp.]